MKTLRRPMFRKGGNVGTGVMTGIVDRGNYATGTPNLKNIGEGDIQETVNLIRGGGQDMGSDPLTDFLLQFGPNLLSQTPKGRGLKGLLATAGEASKEPFKDLLKTKRSQRSEDIALRAKAIEMLGKDDLKKIRAQAEVSIGPQLETETSEEYAARVQDKMGEFIDSTYAKSPFLKPESPEEKIYDFAKSKTDSGEIKYFSEAENRGKFELDDYKRLKKAGVNIKLLRGNKLRNPKTLKNKGEPGFYYDDNSNTYIKVGVLENGVPFIEQDNITFEELIQN